MSLDELRVWLASEQFDFFGSLIVSIRLHCLQGAKFWSERPDFSNRAMRCLSHFFFLECNTPGADTIIVRQLAVFREDGWLRRRLLSTLPTTAAHRGRDLHPPFWKDLSQSASLLCQDWRHHWVRVCVCAQPSLAWLAWCFQTLSRAFDHFQACPTSAENPGRAWILVSSLPPCRSSPALVSLYFLKKVRIDDFVYGGGARLDWAASILMDHGPIRHFQNGKSIHNQFVWWWWWWWGGGGSSAIYKIVYSCSVFDIWLRSLSFVKIIHIREVVCKTMVANWKKMRMIN